MHLYHLFLVLITFLSLNQSISFSMTRHRQAKSTQLHASSSSSSSSASSISTTFESLASLKAVPRVLIFDLDNTLWTPELYQIRQRTPPQVNKDIRLFPASLEILEFWKHIQTDHSHPLYGVPLAVASRTSKKQWAEQLLDDFTIGQSSSSLRSLFQYIEIRTGSKKQHLADIRTASGVPYSSMLFFDDDARMNLGETSQLGVLSCHTPKGMTTEHFVKALHKFSELKAGHDDQHWMGYILDSSNLQIKEESTTKSGTKCVGRVKFYSSAKRFGFVVDEATGNEFFVHESKIPLGVKLQTGDKIEFEANTDGQGRPSATILSGSSSKAPKDKNTVSMQCFTMSQPFAALLLNGMKTVESRNTPMFQDIKPGTRLLLHCGRKDWHDLESYLKILEEKGFSNDDISKANSLPPGFSRGSVVGVVTIGKTWKASDQELNSKNLQNRVLAPSTGIGKFCTEILEAQWLKMPVQMRGNPGIYNIDIPKDALP